MSVADLSEMIVKASINEVDVGKLKRGQRVEIGFDAIKGKVYEGKVRRISPSGTEEENLVVYPVEVEILNSDEKIRPGMTADLDIIIAEAENVICIPKHAVINREGRTMVNIRKENKFVPRPIITGIEDEVMIEVKEGIDIGDTLMIPSGELFVPGGGQRRGPPPGR